MQGIIGACSEEAVLAVYPGCQLDPCETSENAVQVLHISTNYYYFNELLQLFYHLYPIYV